MEINNFSQSASLIYQNLAQERAELTNVDKKDLEKSTQESYDKVNISDNKYNETGANLKPEENKDESDSIDKLSTADAEITRTANLNRLLLESQDYNQGERNEN